jgi:hypothetical protein
MAHHIPQQLHSSQRSLVGRSVFACRHGLVVAALPMVVAVAGCGGGGAVEPPTLELALSVELLPQGSLVTCNSERPTQARLTRAIGSTSSSRDISCPSRQMLSADFALSDWEIAPLPLVQRDGQTLGVVKARTALPAPVMVRDGDRILALADAGLAALQGDAPVLEATNHAGEQPQQSGAATVAGATPAAPGPSQWRWTILHDGTTYASPSAQVRQISVSDTGDWGALAISDSRQTGSARLIGVGAFAAMGLGPLTTGRDFRDIRFVDLDNDGLEDVVSNVYGTGCVLIAMAKPGGGYEVQTPARSDGSCIGGHGETILVADFDGDGLVDIFLPAYERFDYLRNLGHGQFAEVADELGISFPGYLPHVEGAAAIDINLDGAVDIVVANEVLINDGTGHFTRLDHPFGPDRVFDEGMSVADIDGDGVFDIVKSDPAKGPRIFWGASSAPSFVDAGWMLGGATVSASAYGMAVGDLFGSGSAQIVIAGGDMIAGAEAEDQETQPTGGSVRASPPPRVCVQTLRRQFDCLADVIPALAAWQDLLLITDADADGIDDLVARYGTVHTYSAARAGANVFRIDLRDAQGHRNRYGQALKAVCTLDGSFIALKAVDGGNGYMAQGNYVVSFQSSWCRSITIEVPSKKGSVTYGPFAPGLQLIRAL